MRIEVTRGRRPGFTAIVVFAGIAASVIYAVARHFSAVPSLPCFWREIAGTRCPGCGTTTALQHLLFRRPLEALHTNPMMTALYLAGAFICLNAVVGLITNRRVRLTPTRIEAIVAAAGFFALLAANWVYLLLK